MSVEDVLTRIGDLPFRWKLLLLAGTVVLVELAFRYLAPGSRAYVRWTAFFRGIGMVWTAVILSVVYAVSVGAVGIVMRLVGHDPLDRTLHPEPSFWRAHEPNPLGPERAARHQF